MESIWDCLVLYQFPAAWEKKKNVSDFLRKKAFTANHYDVMANLSSHNHGSVKNGCISNFWLPFKYSAIFPTFPMMMGGKSSLFHRQHTPTLSTFQLVHLPGTRCCHHQCSDERLRCRQLFGRWVMQFHSPRLEKSDNKRRKLPFFVLALVIIFDGPEVRALGIVGMSLTWWHVSHSSLLSLASGFFDYSTLCFNDPVWLVEVVLQTALEKKHI